MLRQIQLYRKKKSEQRTPIGTALPVASSIMESLKNVKSLKFITPAGSLRRFRDFIGDIDLMGIAGNPVEVIQAFSSLPQVREILEKGNSKASAIVFDGIQVDLRIFNPDSFGSALQYFTGSQQHNLDLRKRAVRLGLSLSEYGITDLISGKLEKYATEEDFYQRQGLDYIPPEIREGQLEIELAERGALPRLVEISDIKGDLHIHTDWSDGNVSLENIAQIGREKGYGYIGITDHSIGLGIARGLNQERIKRQIQEIKELNRKHSDIRILAGLEVDILANGSLDIPDEILAELDVVLASVHSAMNQNEEQMTNRIISAIENPHVDIIAHPTGRLLGEREPVAINLEAVFKAAVRNNTALEINSMPNRLDLKDTHIYQAREMGVKLVISTDSHQKEHLDYMRFGVGTARRGWCEARDILNTQPLDKLVQFLKRN